jgi:hypothetical protein
VIKHGVHYKVAMFQKESTALPESPVPAAFPLHAHSGADDIPCMSMTISLVDEH